MLQATVDDPRKFYLLGPGTESRERLLEAYAAIQGKGREEIIEPVPAPRRWQAFLEEKKRDEELIELGKQAEAEAGHSFRANTRSRSETVATLMGAFSRFVDWSRLVVGGVDPYPAIGFTEMERRKLDDAVRDLKHDLVLQ